MLLRAFQLTIHDSQGQVSSNKLSYRVWLINVLIRSGSLELQCRVIPILV